MYAFEKMYYENTELSRLYLDDALLWCRPEREVFRFDPSKITVAELTENGSYTGNIGYADNIYSAKVFLANNTSTLYEIYVGDEVEESTLLDNMFSYSPNLVRFTMHGFEGSLGAYAFSNCTYLTYIDLGDNVTSIGDNAFRACRRLQEFHYPKNLESLGTYAFGFCVSLKSLDLSEGITEIPAYCFRDCESFTSIKIPSGVTFIDNYAFGTCSNLKTVSIPRSVTKIGSTLDDLNYNVFGQCDNLETIYIERNPYFDAESWTHRPWNNDERPVSIIQN